MMEYWNIGIMGGRPYINMLTDKNFKGKKRKIAHELSRINRKKMPCKFVLLVV